MVEILAQNVGKVEFVDVTKENKKIVEQLNNRIFPIVYQPFFYKEIIHHGKKDFNKLVNCGSTNIGVILCKLCYLDDRLEPTMKLPEKFVNLMKESCNVSQLEPSTSSSSQDVCECKEGAVDGDEAQASPVIKDSMIYISALGLIPMFRGEGIGKLMMKHVLGLADKTPGVKYIGLHVQTTNTDALKFYTRYGFIEASLIPTYYRQLQPSSAYFLFHPL